MANEGMVIVKHTSLASVITVQELTLSSEQVVSTNFEYVEVFLAAGVLYLGLAGVALIALRHDPAVGRANLVFIILVVWASDSAAYLAGRALGGPRLAPARAPRGLLAHA